MLLERKFYAYQRYKFKSEDLIFLCFLCVHIKSKLTTEDEDYSWAVYIEDDHISPNFSYPSNIIDASCE